MKKVLIITGDAKKVEGFAHEQRYRFKRDKMTAELKNVGSGEADEAKPTESAKTEEPAKTEGGTLGNGGEGDTKEAPKEDTKEAPKEDSKEAPKEDGKEGKKEDKKASKTDKK